MQTKMAASPPTKFPRPSPKSRENQHARALIIKNQRCFPDSTKLAVASATAAVPIYIELGCTCPTACNSGKKRLCSREKYCQTASAKPTTNEAPSTNHKMRICLSVQGSVSTTQKTAK